MIPYQPKNPASQINALKSAYLMAGGHDTNLLRQMNETMGDAMNKHVTRMGGVGYGAEGGQPKRFMGVPEPEMSATEAMRVTICHYSFKRLIDWILNYVKTIANTMHGQN